MQKEVDEEEEYEIVGAWIVSNKYLLAAYKQKKYLEFVARLKEEGIYEDFMLVRKHIEGNPYDHHLHEEDQLCFKRGFEIYQEVFGVNYDSHYSSTKRQ